MASPSAHNSTYLMPASPVAGRRASVDYWPSTKKAQGHVPACLVNASVTYYGNDQVYAFGGFDQFTDEGLYFDAGCCEIYPLMSDSVQPCAQAGFEHFGVGSGG